MADDETSVLSATHVVEYTYRRSVGPVLGRFFAGLRERRIEGVRAADGRVLVPPSESDPATGESTRDEFVEVGPGVVRKTGKVTALEYYLQGREAVYAANRERLLEAVSRYERVGELGDLACFEPEAGA